jgi:hypothetical protein
VSRVIGEGDKPAVLAELSGVVILGVYDNAYGRNQLTHIVGAAQGIDQQHLAQPLAPVS